jgi:hypothetical protein
MVRKLKDIKESDSKRQLGSVNRIFKFVLVWIWIVITYCRMVVFALFENEFWLLINK